MASDELQKAFLEEMHALDNFRMAYAAEHPSTPLDRDDPDVRRLMEAMAFFTARTRIVGLRNGAVQFDVAASAVTDEMLARLYDLQGLRSAT